MWMLSGTLVWLATGNKCDVKDMAVFKTMQSKECQGPGAAKCTAKMSNDCFLCIGQKSEQKNGQALCVPDGNVAPRAPQRTP